MKYLGKITDPKDLVTKEYVDNHGASADSRLVTHNVTELEAGYNTTYDTFNLNWINDNGDGISINGLGTTGEPTLTYLPDNDWSQADEYGKFVFRNQLLSLIYPVGSIYMSVNNTSPQSFLGGTWERIQDRFLLAAGSTYSAGGTGGAATVTLTENQIPAHTHDITYATYNRGTGTNATSHLGYTGNTKTTSSTGGGAAHNNMPPYLTVYMWKRTA